MQQHMHNLQALILCADLYIKEKYGVFREFRCPLNFTHNLIYVFIVRVDSEINILNIVDYNENICMLCSVNFQFFFKVEGGGRMGLRDRERDQEALAYIHMYSLLQ